MPSSDEARFFPNTVALTVYTAAGSLLTLLQVKLLANTLAKDIFGLYASLRGLSLLLAMVAANGFPALLVRFFPAHEIARSRSSAARLGFISFALTSAALLICAVPVYMYRSSIFGFMPENMLTPRLFFWFFAAAFSTSAKLVLYGGFNGLRRISQQVAIETLSITAVLMWLYIERQELDIEMIFKIIGTVYLAATALGALVLGKYMRFSEITEISDDKYHAGNGPRGYGSYWIGAAGLSLVAVAFSDFDRYLLSQIMALEVLALFHIGSRILKLANRVLTIPNIAFQPEITRLSAKGRAPRVQLSTKVLLKFNLLVAVLLALLIISFSREVIIAVSSREYLNAAPLLIIYCFSLPLSTLTAPITTVMKAVDQIRGALWCDLAWAGSYIILLFALGAPFGIMGVGAAHIIACLAQLVLALRISNLDLGRNFIKQLALKILISTLAALVPLAAYRFIIPPGINGGILFLLKIVTSIIALALFTVLSKTTGIFDEDEKLALIKVLSNKRLDFLGKIFA